MKCFYSVVFFACSLFTSFSVNAQGWKLANTPTGINQIRDMITFEGNLFISIDGVVYRSDDHGQSWDYVMIPYWNNYCSFAVQGGELFIINDRYVSRSADGFDWQSNVIATTGLIMTDVTSDGAKLWATTFEGIYSSTDGEIWDKVDKFSTEAFYTIVAEGSKLFASSMFQNGKLAYSTDGGQNWSSKTIGSTFVARLEYKNDVMLAAMDNGVWRSVNDGDTWQQVRGVGIFFSSGSAYYHIGNAVVSSSPDNGVTWLEKASQLPPYFGQIGAVLDGQLFLGVNGGGIFKTSISDLSTWQQVNGDLRTFQVLDFEYHQGEMFMSSTSRGVVSSDDEGETWVQRSDATLPISATVGKLQSVGDDLFAVTSGSVIFRSADGGQSWVDLGAVAPSEFILAIGSFKGQLVVAGGSGVYMTSDRGETWTKSAGITGAIEGISSDYSRLYCVSRDEGLMRYNESTQTWTAVPINGTNKYVGAITFIGDMIVVQSEGGVATSEDEGATWTMVDDNVSFYEMSTRHSGIYRNRDSQFSQSLDSGATWSVIGGNHGLALRFGFSGRSVFAAFNGTGVWHRPVEEFAPPFVEADTTFAADEAVVITFDHRPFNLDGGELTEAGLDDMITVTDSEGNQVSFGATLSDDGLTITIVIDDPIPGETYTISVAPVQSASGIQSKGQVITVNAEGTVTGIYEDLGSKVVVYPNPFDNNVTISFGERSGVVRSAELFDITGKHVISTAPMSERLSIDGTHLKPGIYFIKVRDGNAFYVRKVAKK